MARISRDIRGRSSDHYTTEDGKTPDSAKAAWYDREDRYVIRTIEMIRVYQFKMPDGIGPYYDYDAPWPKDWWSAFWDSLEAEHVVEQRREFISRWEERHHPGGRQTDLSDKLGIDPALDPYKRHGQQELADFAGGGPA